MPIINNIATTIPKKVIPIKGVSELYKLDNTYFNNIFYLIRKKIKTIRNWKL